jgi:hypothetical protein
MRTEDKNYKTKRNYVSREAQRNYSLSVAVNEVYISKTWRHPQYSRADKINQHFLYFIAFCLLRNTAALFLSSMIRDCLTLKRLVLGTPPSYLTTLCRLRHRCTLFYTTAWPTSAVNHDFLNIYRCYLCILWFTENFEPHWVFGRC